MRAPGSTSPTASTRRTAIARNNPRIIVLNAVICALALLVVILGYAFINRTFVHPPVDPERDGARPGSVIQIDVLNGCGAPGAGTTFTAYLRARGFDVVEIGNYKSFDMKETLVIDRTGNTATAEKVAYALGVAKQNIIHQINQDYFVDVSVVIGRDYAALKPSP